MIKELKRTMIGFLFRTGHCSLEASSIQSYDFMVIIKNVSINNLFLNIFFIKNYLIYIKII